MKKLFPILAILLLRSTASYACGAGFINIVDPALNPDGSSWYGTILYTQAYSSTSGTTIPSQKLINVTGGGVNVCLVPGLYSPVITTQQPNSYKLTTTWTVPIAGGPYTIAQIQGAAVMLGLAVPPPPSTHAYLLQAVRGLIQWGLAGGHVQNSYIGHVTNGQIGHVLNGELGNGL